MSSPPLSSTSSLTSCCTCAAIPNSTRRSPPRSRTRDSSAWIAAGLNNARLASVSTYFDCLPGFTRLLAQAGDDLARFYAAARELTRQPRAVRHARLCTVPPALSRSSRRRAHGSSGEGSRAARLEVSGQYREHGPGRDTEPAAAILAAHAVEGERAEVVE
ncbi:MAG: hypothetical protein E6K44_01610 [Gammaproteobacteria bacterium]|nr:MAG: hypothetical protein E6K44_01610 [Gammaproteobacteria bacterium]